MENEEAQQHPSYSQAGEDRILHYLFERTIGTRGLRYADLGAAFAAGHNNTFLFYTLGGSGVLVEADPAYQSEYKAVRPRDQVEQLAIVPSRRRHENFISFHKMQDPGWSTTSAEHAAIGYQLGKGSGQETLTVACLTVNELLEKHFSTGSLDILSIDIEGVDIEVLAEIDLVRFRPRSIVVEGSTDLEQRMLSSGYRRVGLTFVNQIFFDIATLQYFRP